MARNTKALTTNRAKPITAFFSVANKNSQQPSFSPNASSLRLPSQAGAENGENSVRSNASYNQSSTSAANGVKGSTSGSMSPRRSERVKPVSLQPAAVIASLKRAREPETQTKSSSNAGRVRAENRRKSKFDSGSDDNTGGAVIYVKSPNSLHRKKPRVSPPTESPRPSNPGMVASSQSDEEELPHSDYQLNDPSAVNNSATKISTFPTPHRDDAPNAMDAMDVDDNHIPISQDKVKDMDVGGQPLKSAAQVTQMLTPPLSDFSSGPPTPAPSSGAKKSTQNIVAAIKARAYAKDFSSPSPEPDQLDFQGDLDSSDDDQLPVLPLPSPKRRNTRDKGRQTDPGPPSKPLTRYLRNCSRSPLGPKVKTQAKPTKKGPDPFVALLKEKDRAAKRGNGSEAIEKAELAVLQYSGKESLLHELDGQVDDDDVPQWGINISSGSIRDILNARNGRQDDSDLDLDEGDRERIMEEEGGKTVLKILEEDKAERCKSANDDKMSGIQLWMKKADAESSAMVVDENYQIAGDGPVVRLLNNSLKCSGLVLNMNLMLAAQPIERTAIASCLLKISLSPNPSLCTDAAFNTLTRFWSSSMQPATSAIRFKDVLDCFRRSGVDSSVLAGQNWRNEDLGVPNPNNRDVVIARLVTLIMTCVRSGRLPRGEILDVSIAMILIGMDAETKPALQRDLTLAIDLTMRCLSPDDSRSRESEFACASRVLQLSASYSPVNKLRLLSLLSNGSGPSRRIAVFVAYCMTTDKQAPTLNMYADLPPLINILEQFQFCSSSGSKPPGRFALYEGTNYIDLGFYIAMLGVAVSNVKDYVSQERQKAKSAAVLESPSKMGDKPKTDLQLLHAALETLHSKISDSRATHLERSRTKAAVKQLAMNIHYQREFWLRHSRETRSITLAQYFGKKS